MVELMVAMAVVLAMSAAAMTVTESSRTTYETDQARTAVNQNLRTGLDMMAVDVRQAGERLPGDVPAILITDGGTGPDSLVLRRNLLDSVLPLCIDVLAGTTAEDVVIADPSAGSPPGCSPVDDADGDGWPDNLQEWRQHRLDHGGQVRAYLYNPVSRVGEYFEYDTEDASGFHLHASDSQAWQNDYLVADLSRVYMLEERTYRLQGDVLQILMNGETSSSLNLVSDITGFATRAFMEDGTTRTSLGPSDAWSTLQSVEVVLSGRGTFLDRTADRSLEARFFPRNVLSQ